MLTRNAVLLMALCLSTQLAVTAHATQSTAPQQIEQYVTPTITGVTTSIYQGVMPPHFISTITGKGGDCTLSLDIRTVPTRGEPSEQVGQNTPGLNRSSTGKNWPPNFYFPTPYKPGVKYMVRVYGAGNIPCAGEARATFGPVSDTFGAAR